MEADHGLITTGNGSGRPGGHPVAFLHHECSREATLEGLEERGARSGRQTAPIASTARRPARRSSRSTRRRPPVSGSLHIGPRAVGYTHTDIVARYRRMRGRRGLLPDGLGRQRADHRAPRAELPTASRATRTLPYDPTFAPPEQAAEAADPDLAAELRRAVRSALTAQLEQAYFELWRRLGLSVDWTLTYTTIGDEGAAHVAARVPAQPAARGHAYSAEAPTLWDVDIADRGRAGRARRPRGARARTTASRSRRRPTASPSSSRPRVPSCSPPASRSSPIPTTRATSRCSAARCARRCSSVEVPVVAHELADPEKGSGIAMICTFGDTTDVDRGGASSQLPVRAIVGRDGRLDAEPPAGRRPTTGRGCVREIAGKTVKQAQTRIVELLTESGEIDGEPRADHPPGEVLGERRPAARDRHEPAVVHPQRPTRPSSDEMLRPGQASCAGGRTFMRVRYENWVNGLIGDWNITPAAVLRRAVPGLVPDRRRRRRSTTADRSLAERRPPARRPVDRRARRLRPRRSAASRAASSAIPT